MADNEYEPRVIPQPNSKLTIAQIAAQADEVAGRNLGAVITKGQRKIGNPEVLKRIGQDSDLYAPEEWENGKSWETYAQYLKMRRLQLVAKLKNATTGHDIGQAFAAWTEEEMENLFFVTNDVATARVTLDYFHYFYPAFLASLADHGVITKKNAQYMRQDLDAYIECCFEGYDLLRDLVHHNSNGTTHSLVELALNKDGETDKPWKKRSAVLDPQKREHILVQSRQLFKHMALSDTFDTSKDIYVDPMDIYIINQAEEIADMATRKYFPHTAQLNRIPAAAQKKREELRREILNACYKRITQDTHIGAVVSVANILNEFERKEADLPQDAVEQFEYAHNAALAHCAKQNYWLEHHQQLDTLPVPRVMTSGIGQRLWPWYGTEDQARGRLGALGKEIEEHLAGAISLRDWAFRIERFTDGMANAVIGTAESPELLLYMRDYTDTLIRELTPAFKKAHKYKANQKEFESLMEVRDKCTALHQATIGWKRWMLEHTLDNYDSPGLHAHVRVMAKVPVPLEAMGENALAQLVYVPAAAEMCEIVKERGYVGKKAPRENITLFPLIESMAALTAKQKVTLPPEATEAQQQSYVDELREQTIVEFNQGLEALRAYKAQVQHIKKSSDVTASDIKWLGNYYEQTLAKAKGDPNRLRPWVEVRGNDTGMTLH